MTYLVIEKHIEDKVVDLVHYLRKHYPTMMEADIKLYTNMLRRIIRKAVIKKSYVDISYFEHISYHAAEEVIASITKHPLANTFENFYSDTYASILKDNCELAGDFWLYVLGEEKKFVAKAYEDRFAYQSRYDTMGDYFELALMITRECETQRLDEYRKAFYP
ncbi:hypothetical protein HB943_05235 [Listeria weihenstephanensis]|uniref:Uncharacterized protein n=1 Tax=Listeria weihenstephanensis TaxID=1006155 RepID=A0A841Z530_9LIST|nr:hypothetical protein [Listeria weihenstephanensis]MBC1499999.1 hypothetical protein [Listeria weihenstephanensis]